MTIEYKGLEHLCYTFRHEGEVYCVFKNTKFPELDGEPDLTRAVTRAFQYFKGARAD